MTNFFVGVWQIITQMRDKKFGQMNNVMMKMAG
jgi:hypothetical protein